MISRRTFFKRAGTLAAGTAAVALVGVPELRPASTTAGDLTVTRYPVPPSTYTVPTGFDVLVSSCWADEVAQRRGVEGQTFTTLNNNTFRVYSDVQQAVNEAESGQSIFVSPGTYRGNVTYRNDVELTAIGSTFV